MTPKAQLIKTVAAGKLRHDGYDEVQQSGQISNSSLADGFWHPYGRFPGFPPARVVSFSPEVLVQVTLQLPQGQELAEKQVRQLEAQAVGKASSWPRPVYGPGIDLPLLNYDAVG